MTDKPKVVISTKDTNNPSVEWFETDGSSNTSVAEWIYDKADTSFELMRGTTRVMTVDSSGDVTFSTKVTLQNSTSISTETTSIQDQQLEIGLVDPAPVTAVSGYSVVGNFGYTFTYTLNPNTVGAGWNIDTGTSTWTSTSDPGLKVGDVVQWNNGDAATLASPGTTNLPSEFSINTNYYVVSVGGSAPNFTIELSATSGGVAITATSTNTVNTTTSLYHFNSVIPYIKDDYLYFQNTKTSAGSQFYVNGSVTLQNSCKITKAGSTGGSDLPYNQFNIEGVGTGGTGTELTIDPTTLSTSEPYIPLVSKLTTLTDQTGVHILAHDASGDLVKGQLAYVSNVNKTLLIDNTSGGITIGNDASTKVDVNGLEIELDAGSGGVNILANGASSFITTSGAITLTGAGGIATTGTITSTGDIDATGYTITSQKSVQLSDRNLKTNITNLDNSLEKVIKLQGVSFDWKENPELGNQIGLIAQDVQEIYPDLVSINSNTGNLGVSYSQLIAPLIESIKELKQEVEFLKQQINN